MDSFHFDKFWQSQKRLNVTHLPLWLANSLCELNLNVNRLLNANREPVAQRRIKFDYFAISLSITGINFTKKIVSWSLLSMNTQFCSLHSASAVLLQSKWRFRFVIIIIITIERACHYWYCIRNPNIWEWFSFRFPDEYFAKNSKRL